MTFDLPAIAVFFVLSLAYNGLISARLRGWVLLVSSLLAVFWLQPALILRFGDFILPAATICLGIAGWAVTKDRSLDQSESNRSDDRKTLVVTVSLVLLMAGSRYLPPELRMTASRPPTPVAVALVMAAGGAILAYLVRYAGRRSQRSRYLLLPAGLLVGLVFLFVWIKSPTMAMEISRVWRGATGRDPTLATPADINWLGFSFIAFRLIHTLRDRMAGLLPALSLREYLTYIVFFPTYTAGPIDRAERFVVDLRMETTPDQASQEDLFATRLTQGGERILVGLFKKFVVADSLAQGLSMDAASAGQANSTIWLWVLLYGYAFRLYLDFAGYSDIAIGVSRLFGFKIPENFNRPYLRSNLTAFWQSWHITLSNWVRFYVFSPMSRWLLRRQPRPSTTAIVFSAQLSTMIVIGLWHGITLNFIIWGAWHGIGLFIHKVWSDRTRSWYIGLSRRRLQKQAWSFFAWLVTFHYVVLGWVWFALPEVDLSMKTFGKLFNIP